MKRLFTILILAIFSLVELSADEIHLKKTCIIVDENDSELVKVAAGHFADDISMVCGTKPVVCSKPQKKFAVIIGALGQSALIDALAEKGMIDVSSIKGEWERYRIEIVKNPVKGVKKALVVAGSDRRAVAYGLFSISKQIGVHPWYWWLDIPAKYDSDPIYSLESAFTSDSPSVKYRGIFINDEDFGLNQWAKVGIDKEYNSIGPRTYERVCELLLRLNANMLYPAMHHGTKAFYTIAENKIVADRYGIVIGTSHHEPLNFNPNTEWIKKTHGEWNYEKNAVMMNKMMKARVAEASPYENNYTIALRGSNDFAMTGSNDVKERLVTVQNALNAQRKIIEEVYGSPAETVPQSFTPYKEVLKLYDAGLQIPEDVTIVWPDDNFGYMKRVSNPEEQKRKGGSGCYYHISYNGKPHGYLWFNTTPPVLMYEELAKVYGTGGNMVWIVNVGDIKGNEVGMDQFLAMAYDWDAFSYDNVWKYPVDWYVNIFGEGTRPVLEDIFKSFYNLSFTRKPEFMGWGFDYNMELKEKCTDSEISRTHYREMDRRLKEYDMISSLAEKMYERIPLGLKTAFMHTVYYPVLGSSIMNKVHLLAQTNREYAYQGRSSTTKVAEDVKMWRDSLDHLTDRYNAGKWNKVMSIHQIPKTAYADMPTLFNAKSYGKSYGIEVDGGGMSSINVLPQFNSLTGKKYGFEIYSCNELEPSVSVVSKPDWANLQMNNNKYGDLRAEVTIDWKQITQGETCKGQIMLDINGARESVYLSAYNPSLVPQDIKFIEDCGVVSIDAASYSRIQENEEIKLTILENFGVEGRAIMLGDGLGKPQALVRTSPCVEYDFWCDSRGMVDIYTYILPTFELYNALPPFEHEVQPCWTRYGILVDDGQVIHPTFSAPEYSGEWYVNVQRNCAIKKTTHYIDKPGKHTVRLICGTPGVIFQKIVIDFGGLKRSYMGPEPTKIVR
jgi:hypothetical protein